MFWPDIARFLQYFINLSNSFINIFAISQDFNGIFWKYSFNITVLYGNISHLRRVQQLVFSKFECPLSKLNILKIRVFLQVKIFALHVTRKREYIKVEDSPLKLLK